MLFVLASFTSLTSSQAGHYLAVRVSVCEVIAELWEGHEP